MHKYENENAELQEMIDEAANNGWFVNTYCGEVTGSVSVEMKKHSPAGENFSILIKIGGENQAETFLKNLEKCATDFDVDEHVEMWIEAKRNGVSGIPSVEKLVENANAIKDMIQELADKLEDTATMTQDLKED